MTEGVWKVCSACRSPIRYGVVHWVCSVSTCNRARTALVFCSVGCWDSHLSTLRHREAWAVEARAPRTAEEAAEQEGEPDTAAPPAGPPPARRVVTAAPAARAADSGGGGGVGGGGGGGSGGGGDDEVLIVVSRMKKFIKDRSGMSTSESVAEELSVHVRALCEEAIRNAQQAGRKTVMDRDVPRRR